MNSTASAVAVETLGEEIGDFGINDIEKFKEKNDEFANEVKKLRLALAALASNKLIGFITFLTQAVNLFNRGGGVGQGGGMLGRAAGFAVAQGEMADEGALEALERRLQNLISLCQINDKLSLLNVPEKLDKQK